MRGLVVVLVSLVAGGGVGYLLGSSDAAPPRGERAGHRTADVAGQRRESSPDRSAGGTDASVREALAALPRPEPRAGAGRITGIVRTEDGTPLAGATVRSIPHVEPRRVRDARKGRGPPAGVDLENQVRDLVWRHYGQQQGMRTITTGADGTFVLEGLADTTHRVRAYREGYVIGGAGHWRWEDARPGAELEFVATPVVLLTVDVRGPDGSQPPRARIVWKRGEAGSSETGSEFWSPGAPEIALKPGAYTLEATVDDGTPLASPAKTRTLKRGRTPEPVLLTLEARPVIRGQVVYPDDLVPVDLDVFALRFEGAEPAPDAVRAGGRSEWIHQGRRFAFEDVEPGRWKLVAFVDGEDIALGETVVSVGPAPVDAKLPVRIPDRERYVIVRARGPEGELLKDLEVETSYRAPNRSMSGEGAVLRRRDGTLLVFHRGPAGPAPDGARFTLTVRSQTHGRKTVEYDRDGDAELDVSFGEPATVVATVTGLREGDAQRIRLTLSPADAEPEPVWFHDEEPTVDSEGRQVLGPVQAGRGRLTLYVKVGEDGDLPAEERVLDLAPGENRVTLAMPRLHELTLLVPDAEQGTKLSLRTAGRYFPTVERSAGEGGEVVFRGLPAGEYVVARDGDAVGRSMRVEVPRQGAVRFAPQEKNALEVTVRDPEGMIAKSGFRTGDVVVGIDGKEFRNALHMQALFAGVVARGQDAKVRFDVLRDGRRLEIVVPVKSMIGGDGGGNLEPVTR